MNCPVCKRELAPTLSICLTCGAMMNDTVREELETKITSNSGGLQIPQTSPDPPRPAFLHKEAASLNVRTSSPERQNTVELPPKNTSPTLVEFQPGKVALPDWRLQIQNSVRQRGVEKRPLETAASTTAVPSVSGSNRYVPASGTDLHSMEPSNPRLTAAMRRIEESRNTFLPKPVKRTSESVGASPAQRKFPFAVVTPTADQLIRPKPVEQPEPVERPKLVSALKIEKRQYDTNKLPKVDSIINKSEDFDIIDDESPFKRQETEQVKDRSEPLNEAQVDRELFSDGNSDEEIDDLAPFSMRVGAGLFDLIIGGFGTLIILSPFMASGGVWNSFAGYLTFAGSLGIFLFLYLTASLAFWGKTFGMRIFGLELIDADANVYPTVHQAAVNSAVFLLSMTFGGLGFLTVIFSEERRALHDIVSGTLLIRDS